MTIFQALILGIVQGITEFFPVSSSGHLTLFQQLFGLQTPPLLFDVLVHVGTLFAVIIYFRSQIVSLFKSHLNFLVIGTIPAVIAGFFVFKNAQYVFTDLNLVGYAFLATAALLFFSSFLRHKGNSLDKIDYKQAFIIGLFQATAIIPGLSRSGSTIVAGRLTGLSKPAAFTFSFILSIPAILGALILNLSDLANLDPQLYFPSFIGFVSALITGVLSLKLLDIIFRQKNLLPFAFYILILGSALLGLIT